MRAFVKNDFAKLKKSAEDTVDFLLFMDKLFDSMNSSSKNASYSKLLKGAVTESSNHVDFWYGAIKVLESSFFSNDKRSKYIPPTIKNWVTTIRGVMQISRNLLKKDVQYLCTRHLNQDPLENFFGIIRSHGGRHINPTATNFKGSFKTLMINNFSAATSPWMNCEEDVSTGSLDSLRSFLEGVSTEEDVIDEEIDKDFILAPTQESNLHVKAGLYKYIGGYVTKKNFKNIGRCSLCVEELGCGKNPGLIIRARAINANSLLIPNSKFEKLVIDSCNVLKYFVPKYAESAKLSLFVGEQIKKFITNTLTCNKHNTFEIFVNFIVKFYIYTYVNNVNKYLKGTTTKKQRTR